MTTSRAMSLGNVQPGDLLMEFRCVCLTPYLRFLEASFGKARTAEIVAETGMSLPYLSDPDAWVSYGYACRLLAKLVEETGDKMAPFNAALQYTSHNTYKALGVFLTHLGSPSTMYRLATMFRHLWSKTSHWKLEALGPKHARISVTMLTYRQDRNNCLAIQGSLAAFPCQFGLPPAEIRELQCACEGANSCEYELAWKANPSHIGALASAAATAGVCLASCAAAGWNAGGVILSFFAVSAAWLAGRLFDCKRELRRLHHDNASQAAVLLETLSASERDRRQLQVIVEERTWKLQTARDDLQKAMKVLEDTQEQRIHSERQAAIGVLAAGMAHELNSPINAIRLSTQTLLEDAQAGPAAEHLCNIERASGRCKRLVNELLSFSRENRSVTMLYIGQIVRDTLAIWRQEHAGNITIEEHIPEFLPRLMLDRMQIQQAIVNILDNACEAMKGTGVIRVELRFQDGNIFLRISDSGPGIPEENLRNLMKPFHTSKPSGHGLGLAISDLLVTRNGGRIHAESKVGEGTTFTIVLPVGTGNPDILAFPGSSIQYPGFSY